MSSLDKYYVERLIKPVRLLFRDRHAYRVYQCSTKEELINCITSECDVDDSTLVISICQRNSWKPLGITEDMLEFIFSHYQIDSTVFGDIPSSFYQRGIAVEEGFCVPFTKATYNSCTEAGYTIRYPEFKKNEEDGEWVIRQTGVYHRFDTSTRRSIYILLNPTTDSKAQLKAQDCMAAFTTSTSDVSSNWLHRVVLSVYLPAWRQYIVAYERGFLNIRNKIMATENHIPFPGGYDDLSRLASLENRFLQMQVLLKQSLELMDSLIADPDTNGLPAAVNGLKAVSSQVLPAPEWHKARCAAYLFAADYLHKRTQSAIQLLTLGISLQDQAIAKDQNAAMLGLNRSVGFITTITLFYLPASFVSTFFGMSFFGLEETSGRLISSHMIWIYVLSAAILTACTLALYSRQGDWFYGWVRGKTSGSSIEMKSLGSRFRAAMV